MRVEFKYDSEGRPFAEVKLKNRGKELLLGFLVDSGADFSLIPKSAADYLQLKRENLQFADSASGSKVPYYLSIATFEISGHEFKSKIACALDDDVPYLLGRKNVFEKFLVCFDEKNKKTKFIQD